MTDSSPVSDLPSNSRIILLDSCAVLKGCFEGYQAPRTSSYNGRAMDVAALYGYLYRTMKIYESFEFEALVHIMDPPGGSHHRYSLYPEYKANRKEKDPLLAAQEALMRSMLESFGERFICLRGVEADDVIATLAQRLADEGHQVMVISPDKDLMQLVEDGRISLARYVDDPRGMGKTYSIYEEKEVLDVMGVRADQVADFLSLTGDASDNIPGVFRCGDKTAAKWIGEYGDLVTLMTNADEIKGKIGENLRESLEVLPLYQTLTTVLRDVPKADLPPIPEVDDEAHAIMRDVLVLPDEFPARFSVGGMHQQPTPQQKKAPAAAGARGNGNTRPVQDRFTSTPAQPASNGQGNGARPAAFGAEQSARPARINPDGLTAPEEDPLAGGNLQQGKATLGDALKEAQAPEDATSIDPFADMGVFGDTPDSAASASSSADTQGPEGVLPVDPFAAPNIPGSAPDATTPGAAATDSIATSQADPSTDNVAAPAAPAAQAPTRPAGRPMKLRS